MGGGNTLLAAAVGSFFQGEQGSWSELMVR